MKYYVSVNGEDHEVTLDEHGVQVDGERVSATVESINGSPVRMVTIGDEVHRVAGRADHPDQRERPHTDAREAVSGRGNHETEKNQDGAREGRQDDAGKADADEQDANDP